MSADETAGEGGVGACTARARAASTGAARGWADDRMAVWPKAIVARFVREYIEETDTTVLHRSPLAVLVPHLLGLIASKDPIRVGKEVLSLLTPHDVPKITVPTISDRRRALMGVFWGDSSLDALRLGMVVSQWGEVSYLCGGGVWRVALCVFTSRRQWFFSVPTPQI